MLLQLIAARRDFKYLILILGTGVVFLFAHMPAPCGHAAGVESLYSSISAQELKEMMDQNDNFNLVDIRSIQEYVTGHIPDAVSIPYRQLPYRYRELNPDIKTVVYCRTGQSCYLAVRLLSGFGFTDLYILTGGIAAWEYAIELENGIKII